MLKYSRANVNMEFTSGSLINNYNGMFNRQERGMVMVI